MKDLGLATGCIIGISEMLKKAGFPKKLIPVINLILGIFYCFFFESYFWKDAILYIMVP